MMNSLQKLLQLRFSLLFLDCQHVTVFREPVGLILGLRLLEEKRDFIIIDRLVDVLNRCLD